MNDTNNQRGLAQQSYTLETTRRGARQDAELAMGNDPIRALVELITNCDDSYRDKEGRIVVELNRGTPEWTVSVRDRAAGMSQAEMKQKLLRVGGRTSGFESGADVRGNLGRGAKDASIFGIATFESIKNDRYCSCEIRRAQEYSFPVDERPATDDDRRRLGIPKGSGTVVTITVTNGARCPQYATLKRELTNHYQLREIMLSPRRELYLKQRDNGLDRITFAWPKRVQILEQEIRLTTYPGASCQLTVWRFDDRDEGSPSPQVRLSGILVTGDKAIYENTFFSHENRPSARWFSGILKVPYIDHLARTYDDNDGQLDAKNPVGIIRRDRGGLIHAHPFYEALQAEVDVVLNKLVDEEDAKHKKAESKISQKLSKDLNELGRALGKMFAEDLEETDEELPKDGGSNTPAGKIEIIPAKIVAYLGETKTISVRVHDSVGASRIRVNLVPEQFLRLSDNASLKLREGKTTLTFVPHAIGSGILSAHAGNDTQTAEFEVRAARPDPPAAPTRLEFEHELYSVKFGKPRKVRLLAPESVVFEHGDRVDISIKGTAIFRRGGDLRLAPNSDGIFECTFVLEAREQTGAISIVASVGGTQAKTVARISVSREDGFAFQFSLEDEARGFRRAEVEGNRVMIMGKHPSVSKLLGPSPIFPHQDEPIGRAAIAEIIASEVTRKVIEAKYKNNREMDAATLYFEHQQLLSKYLPRCQSALL